MRTLPTAISRFPFARFVPRDRRIDIARVGPHPTYGVPLARDATRTPRVKEA